MQVNFLFNCGLNQLIIGVFSSLLFIGCTPLESNKINKYANSKPLVLTTFTVLADIAKNVSGDRLDVESVTKFGAEIHGYQPTPSDIVKASMADLIVENGLGLELWARKFTAAAGNVPKIVLSDGMTPLLIEGDAYKGKPNPHAWMSPIRTMKYVDNMARAFIALDPEGENIYLENARKYKLKLEELDDELKSILSSIPKKKRVLVSCEGAFTYLAHDYGMEEAYLWPVNAESQVTPKRMLNLIKTVKEKQIPTIFCESTVSSKAQEEVAKASGALFGGTFYVDSLSTSDGPASTLIDLHRHNVQLIKKGLAPELND